MKTDLGKALNRLAQRQRNRLWLNRVLSRSPVLLTYIASVFFLAAGIHQLVTPLNFPLMTGIAIIPALLFLGFLCATQKPTPQQGAAAADKRFAANSLFVSAWEMTRFQSDTKGAAALLLERCEKALPEWSGSTRQVTPGNLKPSGLITVTLAILGLFFLWQPSHVQTRQSPQKIANSSPDTFNEDNSAVAQKLSKLLDNDVHTGTRTLEQSGDPATTAAAATARDSNQVPPSPGTRESGAPAQAQESSRAVFTAQHSPANAAGASTRIAKRSAGSDAAEAQDSSVIQPTEFEQTQLVDIETGSDPNSMAGDGSSEGNQLIESKSGQIVAGQPDIEHWRHISANGAIYMLSPQQRKLVWRYFAQLDKTDDPRE